MSFSCVKKGLQMNLVIIEVIIGVVGTLIGTFGNGVDDIRLNLKDNDR